jgi:hypothetical protein
MERDVRYQIEYDLERSATRISEAFIQLLEATRHWDALTQNEKEKILRMASQSEKVARLRVDQESSLTPNRDRLLVEARRIRIDTDSWFGDVQTYNTADEVSFTWVCFGRNASHTFYIGVDSKDRLWKRTVGEDGESIYAIDSWENIGFTGHY